MTLITLVLEDFQDVRKFIHKCPTCVITTRKSCLNDDSWLISKVREWNLGMEKSWQGA
jgi:hypothetical protein